MSPYAETLWLSCLARAFLLGLTLDYKAAEKAKQYCQGGVAIWHDETAHYPAQGDLASLEKSLLTAE